MNVSPYGDNLIERHGRFHDFVPRLRDNIMGLWYPWLYVVVLNGILLLCNF